jgi:hypothetical protein
MTRASCLLVSVVLLSAGQAAHNVSALPTVASSAQQEPQVTDALLKGNKLIVVGGNFSEDAVILVNGERINTRSDPDNPTGRLIAKKAGKRIPLEKVVAIAVRNDNGIMSQAFDFFSGRTITFDDAGKTINLAVGEKFQLLLKRSGYGWAVDAVDPLVVSRLINEPVVPGSQGIFQAVLAGKTQLSATGQLPCSKATPPCAAPSLVFEVTLVID